MLLGCSCTRHRISHLSHISNSMGDVSGCLLRCDVLLFIFIFYMFFSFYLRILPSLLLGHCFLYCLFHSLLFSQYVFLPHQITHHVRRDTICIISRVAFFCCSALSLSLLIFLCSLPSTTYAPSTCTEYINISMNFTYHFDGMAFVLYYSICVCGVCSLRLLWSSRC